MIRWENDPAPGRAEPQGRDGGARRGLLRFLRPWRGESAERTAGPGILLPVRAPLPPADLPEEAASALAGDERLRDLAGRFAEAGPGARELGENLADRVRADLPDVPDGTLARVMLATALHVADLAAGQADEAAALTVIGDAMLGAPAALASLDLALAERGSRW